MIQLREVNKRYSVGGDTVVGLKDVSIELNKGDFACLRGASGSGKTTLLLTIGGMQRPTSGTVGIAYQEDIYALGDAARGHVRAQSIGFIFQLFHLVPYLNVLDYVQLGANTHSNSRDDVAFLIKKLGLWHRRYHKPAQLSVGECQRVAVARALVSRPEVILADEPTGNLDEDNTSIVITALEEFCSSGGVVLLATHSDRKIESINRAFDVRGGVVKEREVTVN